MDWEISSNIELENECKRLETEYLKKQKTAKKSYEAMVRLAEKFKIIKGILDKRKGMGND